MALLAGGTAVGQALVILTSPLLTRLYPPEQFGAFAVYTALLAIAIGAVALRYEVAIPLPETEAGAGNLLALCGLLSLATAGLTALAVWGLGDHLARWTGTPALQGFLWLLPASLAMGGVAQSLDYWGTRRQAYPRITRAKLTETFTQVAAQLGLGALGLGAPGLVLGRVGAQAAGNAVMAGAGVAAALRQVTWRGILQAAYRYRRFPYLACGACLLNSVGLQLAPLLLASLYGPRVAGHFALSQRMVGVPMAMIGAAVAQVYAGEVARLGRGEPRAVWQLFVATGRKLLLLGAGPILLLGLIGPWLFSLVFGPEWQEAGHYTRLLIIMMLMQFVAVPLSYTLDAMERQDLQLAWDVGRILLVFGSLYASARLHLAAGTAMTLYGLAMTVSYGALLWVSALAIKSARPDRRAAAEVTP
ncbi:MAG TPA: lipopolysaccharide biosynthesis protein [Symbiobacteriaceae bacterium]|nr:lipopolysaccharide biosynthesis protein [Symbiobacteriaceae bacterium]